MDRLKRGISGIAGERKPDREREVEREPETMSCARLAMEVTSVQGEKLGKVEEIMLDYETGRVAYALLSFESSAGLGDELYPIPWEAFTLSTAREKLILNIPKDRLRNAPGVKRADWRGEPGKGWITAVYSYYGYIPYWIRR